MEFSQCHPQFQRNLLALAQKYEKPVNVVYGWWQIYTKTCHDFDQSPVLFEFENWYQQDLTKPLVETQHGLV